MFRFSEQSLLERQYLDDFSGQFWPLFYDVPAIRGYFENDAL
jgi:hypothetical protein